MNIVRFRLITYLLISLLDIAIFIVTLHAQLNVLTGRPFSGFPKVFLVSVSAGTFSVPCILLLQYVAPSSCLSIPVVEVAWLFLGSALYLAGSFVILFVNVPLLCNDRATLRSSETRSPSACTEFNATRFLWWINTAILIMALVVVTTWLLIQSARGSQRVWTTPITRLQMSETKDFSTPAYHRKSFYTTTSARLAPYLGQPQLADGRGSSVALIYPTDPAQVAPQPRQSGEFTRAKYVSIGTGYVRANDPSAALRQMGQPVYAAVPTADSSLPREDLYGPGVLQTAPTISAFFNPNASSSQSSITSSRSYPYQFPVIPPSQSESRPTSHGPSLTDQPPLHTQPLGRGYTAISMQYNQKSNGNMSNGPVLAREESFRTRGGKNRQTAFSVSSHYTGQEDDDASSVASRYSTATTTTRVTPKHSGTALPPISVHPPPPKLPPAGPPPPIPMRSPMRQSFAHSDLRQQGSGHLWTLKKV